eukprot:358752-Chlamydomonas_euryale.AAC.22
MRKECEVRVCEVRTQASTPEVMQCASLVKRLQSTLPTSARVKHCTLPERASPTQALKQTATQMPRE